MTALTNHRIDLEIALTGRRRPDMTSPPHGHTCYRCGGPAMNGYNWTAKAPERATWYCSQCNPPGDPKARESVLQRVLEVEGQATLDAQARIAAGLEPPPDGIESSPFVDEEDAEIIRLPHEYEESQKTPK